MDDTQRLNFLIRNSVEDIVDSDNDDILLVIPPSVVGDYSWGNNTEQADCRAAIDAAILKEVTQ
jgi:hypothetical protein